MILAGQTPVCFCSFTELSKALDPSKAVKSDKTNIIADAIRVVTQLRAENGQLRQLNKFLEVGLLWAGMLGKHCSAVWRQNNSPVAVNRCSMLQLPCSCLLLQTATAEACIA